MPLTAWLSVTARQSRARRRIAPNRFRLPYIILRGGMYAAAPMRPPVSSISGGDQGKPGHGRSQCGVLVPADQGPDTLDRRHVCFRAPRSRRCQEAWHDRGPARAMSEGLRIYNLFPTLAGPIAGWTRELPRIAAMAFNAVYINPFHYPGFSGSLYAVKDYYRLNPRFRGDAKGKD